MRLSQSMTMFSYYGGKAKLAPLICDFLDYSTTSVYIEPFGGACRTLLNKPRHAREFYNDSSAGLCAFVRLMSQPDTADQLIERLYETEYSQEQFDWALQVRNSVDDSLLTQSQADLMTLYKKVQTEKDVFKAYQLNPQEQLQAQTILDNWTLARNLLESNDGSFDNPINAGIQVSDLELAVATYIVYAQSRDSMGMSWTASKYKTSEAYYKHVDRLYEVAERLTGIEVLQVGALSFLQNKDIIDNPEVCCYADPSYLKPEDEKKNLGKVYKQSFSYEDHELFLQLVCDAKCKMVISNYDVDLYNRYLSHWSKYEIPTTTSVGGKKDNKRTEILWYNY